jgi:hypothetical protein
MKNKPPLRIWQEKQRKGKFAKLFNRISKRAVMSRFEENTTLESFVYVLKLLNHSISLFLKVYITEY